MPVITFYAFLGWMLQETAGHYDRTYLLIVALSFALTFGYSLRRLAGPSLMPGNIGRWKILLASVVLFFCIRQWLVPGIVYPASPVLHAWLEKLLVVIILLAGAHVVLEWVERFKRAAWVSFGGVVVALFIARGLTLLISPHPYIDVFWLTTRASDYLLAGFNPYTQTYPDLYEGAYGYAAGPNYWPVYYYWSVGFRQLGDIRLGSIAADLVTTLFLCKSLRRLGVDDSLARLGVLAWLAFPVSLFVLEQAWIEPAIVAFSAMIVWAGLSGRWRLVGLLLGLVAGLKQYMVVLIPLTLGLIYRSGLRPHLIKVASWAGLSFMLALAPFLILDGRALIQQTVVTYVQREMRLDSFSIPAYLANEHQIFLGGGVFAALYLVIFSLAMGWILWTPPRGLWLRGSSALVLTYGAIFLLGKQAFGNYYYLLAFFVWLQALGLSRTNPD